MDNIYIDLAEFILFTQNKSLANLENKLESLSLEFRKNKGIAEINKAVEKARDIKNGHLKTEIEIEMLSIYLKDIVKVKRPYKVGDKVKIVDYPPKGSGFYPSANPKETPMGKWLGKIMTVVRVQDRCLTMKEDGGRWAWTYSLIEKKVDKNDK